MIIALVFLGVTICAIYRFWHILNLVSCSNKLDNPASRQESPYDPHPSKYVLILDTSICLYLLCINMKNPSLFCFATYFTTDKSLVETPIRVLSFEYVSYTMASSMFAFHLTIDAVVVQNLGIFKMSEIYA